MVILQHQTAGSPHLPRWTISKRHILYNLSLSLCLLSCNKHTHTYTHTHTHIHTHTYTHKQTNQCVHTHTHQQHTHTHTHTHFFTIFSLPIVLSFEQHRRCKHTGIKMAFFLLFLNFHDLFLIHPVLNDYIDQN